MTVITRHVDLRGFATYHTPEQIAAWTGHFTKWLGEGRLVFPHTTVESDIEHAPEVFLEYLEGKYKGNVSLRIGAPS